MSIYFKTSPPFAHIGLLMLLACSGRYLGKQRSIIRIAHVPPSPHYTVCCARNAMFHRAKQARVHASRHTAVRPLVPPPPFSPVFRRELNPLSVRPLKPSSGSYVIHVNYDGLPENQKSKSNRELKSKNQNPNPRSGASKTRIDYYEHNILICQQIINGPFCFCAVGFMQRW